MGQNGLRAEIEKNLIKIGQKLDKNRQKGPEMDEN